MDNRDGEALFGSGGDSMKRGRGRPKKEESYTEMICTRLDDKDMSMLQHLEIESEDTRSDIMRKALRTYYHIRSKTW